MGTCKGKNIDGTGCGNPVKEGQYYCWRHLNQAPDGEEQGSVIQRFALNLQQIRTRSWAILISAAIFILGVIGTVIGLTVDIPEIPEALRKAGLLRSESPTRSKVSGGVLELVDVIVIEGEDEEDDLPKVDFKVRNTAREVAYITKADFTILEVRVIERCGLFALDPIFVSYTYDIELPAIPNSKPYSQSISISQAVYPNDVDRFQFRIATSGDPTPAYARAIYQLKIDLVYNVSDKVSSDEIIVMVPYPWEPMGMTTCWGYDFCSECYKRNNANLLYMLGLPGIRSDRMVDLLIDAEEIRKRLFEEQPTSQPRGR